MTFSLAPRTSKQLVVRHHQRSLCRRPEYILIALSELLWYLSISCNAFPVPRSQRWCVLSMHWVRHGQAGRRVLSVTSNHQPLQLSTDAKVTAKLPETYRENLAHVVATWLLLFFHLRNRQAFAKPVLGNAVWFFLIFYQLPRRRRLFVASYSVQTESSTSHASHLALSYTTNLYLDRRRMGARRHIC